MMIQGIPITGAESITDGAIPKDALIEFYRAFNNQSMELMTANWKQAEDTSMSNPLGGVKRGWDEIKAVYEKLFCGPAHVYVEFYDFTIHQHDEMFCAVGHERGRFTVNDTSINLAIRTSRVYLKDSGRWLQLHHHGSIDNPRLLSEYQSAVTGV